MNARASLGLRAHDRHASELADPEDQVAEECPRGTARSGWTLLEAVGAGALIGWWLYLLWCVIEGLAGPF